MRDFYDEYLENESFVVNTDGRADWCLKKIKEEQAEHDRLQKIIDEEREALQEKQEEIDKRLETKTAYLKGLLYKYFETVEHKETKTQESYKLLSGSLVYKKPSVSIVRPDDDQLISYLENAGRDDMIEVKKAAKWGEVKKTLTVSEDGRIVSEDGEILDFIATEEKAGVFDVKI